MGCRPAQINKACAGNNSPQRPETPSSASLFLGKESSLPPPGGWKASQRPHQNEHQSLNQKVLCLEKDFIILVIDSTPFPQGKHHAFHLNALISVLLQLS